MGRYIHSMSVCWPLGSAATESLGVSPGPTFFLIWGQTDAYGATLSQAGRNYVSLVDYKIACVIRKRCQNALFKLYFLRLYCLSVSWHNFGFKNSKMYKEFHIAKAIIFGYMPLTPFPPFILAEE